jgi:hypothetical protein
MEEITKVCADCGKRKPLSEFYLNRNEKDGHSRICKIDAKLREEKRRRSKGIFPKDSVIIDDSSRRCRGCGQIKLNSEFTPRKDRRGGYRSSCRECVAKKSEIRRRAAGVLPYNESTDSSAYLGVFVGEDQIADLILRQWYKNVIHMPGGTFEHDFLVLDDGVLLKIEVKTSSRLHRRPGEYDRWQFNIDRNKTANWFLLIALNSFVDERTPFPKVEHIWYIPSYEVDTDKKYLTIGELTMKKWSKWERHIQDVKQCCNELRSEKAGDGYINLEPTSQQLVIK